MTTLSDPTFLGTVEDVSGSTIRIKLGDATISGLSFIDGQSYRVGQVGGFVRVPLGFLDLYGVNRRWIGTPYRHPNGTPSFYVSSD
jgi:hypothetical protein